MRLLAIMVHVRSKQGGSAQNARRAERRKLHLRNMRNMLHAFRQGFQHLHDQRNRAEEELQQTTTMAEAQAAAATRRTTETLTANTALIAEVNAIRHENHDLQATYDQELAVLRRQLDSVFVSTPGSLLFLLVFVI